MAITFKDVDESSIKKRKEKIQKIIQEKKEEKQKQIVSKRKTRDLTAWRIKPLYKTFSHTVGITALIVACAAVITWVVMFWFGKTHASEGFFEILKVTVQIYGGLGIALAALQFFNCILICLDSALAESHVYNWGVFVIATIFPILCLVAKYEGTVNDCINKSLTLMSFAMLGLIPVSTSLWKWFDSNSVDAAQSDIDESSKFSLIALLAIFGLVSIFGCVFSAWLKSADEAKASLSYISLYAIAEFLLINFALIVWQVVFCMIEDYEFGIGYTIVGVLIFALPLIASVLMFVFTMEKVVSLYVMFAIFTIVGAPASIGMIVWSATRF